MKIAQLPGKPFANRLNVIYLKCLKLTVIWTRADERYEVTVMNPNGTGGFQRPKHWAVMSSEHHHTALTARGDRGHLLAGELARVPGWASRPDRVSQRSHRARILLPGEKTTRRPEAQQPSMDQATESTHSSRCSGSGRLTNRMSV